MLFVVETEKNKTVEEWVKASQHRAETRQLFLMGDRQIFSRHQDKKFTRIYVILKPIMSNLTLYLAVFIMIPALIFSWDPISYALPIGLALLKFFETEYFGYYALRIALWKIGYKGLIRKVPTSQLIEEAFDGAKRRLQ
jgi:hypothetical protein